MTTPPESITVWPTAFMMLASWALGSRGLATANSSYRGMAAGAGGERVGMACGERGPPGALCRAQNAVAGAG